VLALLFASTKAVNVSKVEGWEAVDDEAEGVHVPDIGANTYSNSGHPVFDFPGPIRTAFYAQTGAQVYDQKNGLWRQSLAQDDPKDAPTAVAGPPEGQIGDTVYEHAMDATSGIPWDRSNSKAPSLAERNKKVDPISPENYDPWVYKFSNENMPPYPQWQTLDDGPPSMAQGKHKKNP